MSVILKSYKRSYSHIGNIALKLGTEKKVRNVMESTTSTQNKDIKFIQDVVSEYQKSGRHELVWRKTNKSYNILVSEIMLQQTQVTRVLVKYNEWMKKYPTLAKLREASFKDVLVLWQGLGYQRRAKALYEIALKHTRVPKNYEALLALKGVGVYTASAVSVFATDTFTHPLLEVNIKTTLIHHFHKNKEAIPDEILYEDLRRLEWYKEVQAVGAKHWYLALMDYGYTLKAKGISYNAKSKGYKKHSPFIGSKRELRARILFAITHGRTVPKEARTGQILKDLEKEGYILKKASKWSLKEVQGQ